MLCEAGKGIPPHCVRVDALQWGWKKRAWGSSTAVSPVLGNWWCDKGKICGATGCGVAIGSGKITKGESVSWQIALNHQDCLQESFLVFAGNHAFCVQFCLKRFIFRWWTQTYKFSLSVRLVCDFQTFKFSALSHCPYLLTCLQQTGNFVAVKRIIVLEPFNDLLPAENA